MKFYLLAFNLILLTFSSGFHGNENQDYSEYHKQIIEAERHIVQEKYEEALRIYEQNFKRYEFIFLRDYKVASQLALYLDNKINAFNYIKDGIAAGWELKELKHAKFLVPLQDDPGWKTIEEEYTTYRTEYLQRIDEQLREKVQKMFKKDQSKAMGALIRIGDKAQEKYTNKKFAPHSEAQLSELIEILENKGYPGEKIIGNDYWMSTIISHHNSISKDFVHKDTLYNFIKPMLIQAIKNGQMSPYEYALIDDWQKALSSDRSEPGYGFLYPPNQSTLAETNELRQKIGLRTVEIRNKLVDVEKRTGMNLYLPDWIKGEIVVE